MFQFHLHFVAPCPPHPFSVGDKQPTILKWRILSATNDLDRVSAVALPKLPISLTNTDLKVASDTQFYPGLGTVSWGSWGSEGGVHCDLTSTLRVVGTWPNLTSVLVGVRTLLLISRELERL